MTGKRLKLILDGSKRRGCKQGRVKQKIGANNEKNIPAKKQKENTQTWVQVENGHAFRSAHNET